MALPITAPPPPPPIPDVGAPLAGQRDGTRDAAIIVAVETYSFGLPTVPGARGNAEAWLSYLRDVRGVPPERIQYLVDPAATRETVLRAIAEMAPQVDKSRRLWFVFIGHGAPDPGGKGGMLVGVDAQAQVDLLKDRSIPQDELLKKLSATPGKPILILDACFSGRDHRGRPLVKGLQDIGVPPDEQTKPRARRTKGPNALILSASGRTEYAGQLADHERPAFSYLVLGALRGWADLDGNGAVTAEEAITYSRNVLTAVLNQTRTQTPMRTGNGAVILAKAAEPEPELIKLLTPSTTLRSRETCSQQTHFEPHWPPLELPAFDPATRPIPNTPSSPAATYAFAIATSADEKGHAAPAAAVQEWCALAKISAKNPYQSVAADMCEQWTAYQEGISWLDSDLRCITQLQQALTRFPEQFVRHLHEFLKRYASLTRHVAVSRLKSLVPYLNTEEILVLTAGHKKIYVDMHPVNVAAYHACVAAGACTPRIEGSSQHCTASNHGTPEAWDRGNPQSIRCISPAQASRYCAWAGKQLPTSEILAAFLSTHTPTDHPETTFLQQFVAENNGFFSLVMSGKSEDLSPDEAYDYVRFRCSRTTSPVHGTHPG